MTFNLKYFSNFCVENMGSCTSENNDGLETMTDAAKLKDLYPLLFKAKVIRVLDGDTVEIVHLFCGHYVKSNMRIYGVDTEELKSHSAKALEAKEFANKHLLNKVVQVQLRNCKTEKYGRLLGDIVLQRKMFSEMLLDAKLAKPYYGGKK